MAFRGRSALVACSVLFVLAGFPRPAEAGILSALARLFSTQPNEVEETSRSFFPESQAATAASALGAGGGLGGDDYPGAGMSVVYDHALVAPLNPLAAEEHGRSGGQIFVYTIRPGDTLSAIAKSFDVTVNTILWANNVSDPRSLGVGNELLILPVSGVKHEVRTGDTIMAIAKRYRANMQDIVQFNGLAPDEQLEVGAVVIVPDGELAQAAPITPGRVRSFTALPAYPGYYARPILGGRRSRGPHGFNAVDLADACGLSVLAAADGTVLAARSSGWNGGYGRYVVVGHDNLTQTLYGHLRELVVSSGQAVRQGAPIGVIGSSGNSTGCHVHFEVRGARNPF